MATFGRYLISLSATLSSWFLRFVGVGKVDRRYANSHRRSGMSRTHPKRGAMSQSFQ